MFQHDYMYSMCICLNLSLRKIFPWSQVECLNFRSRTATFPKATGCAFICHRSQRFLMLYLVLHKLYLLHFSQILILSFLLKSQKIPSIYFLLFGKEGQTIFGAPLSLLCSQPVIKLFNMSISFIFKHDEIAPSRYSIPGLGLFLPTMRWSSLLFYVVSKPNRRMTSIFFSKCRPSY